MDRYLLVRELASGGMGAVYLAKLLGGAGVSRVVAVKRMHPHLLEDQTFVKCFIDEARISSRIYHPNVASTLDVIHHDKELLLVMEYIEGESFSALLRLIGERQEVIPLEIAAAIVIGALQGLQAAHEARDADGQPLGIIHRDISPQNILVSTDGVVKIVDFGVAKAAARLTVTGDAMVKGKIPYMAPEQLGGGLVDRRADLWALAVVFWEALARRRLFRGGNQVEQMAAVLNSPVPSLGQLRAEVGPSLESVIGRGLARDLPARFPTALDMAEAIEAVVRPASQRQLAAWVRAVAAESLDKRSTMVREVETQTSQMKAWNDVSGGAPRKPSRSGKTWPFLLALGGCGALALAGWQWRPHHPPRRFGCEGTWENINLVGDSECSSTPATPATPSSSTSLGSPSASASAPVLSASVAASRPPVAAAPASAAGKQKPGPPKPETPQGPDCTNPYMVRNGHRIIREECANK